MISTRTPADLTGKTVSVVMLTLNEAKAIPGVVADIRAVLPGAEIVIVDSSTDNSADLAESLGCIVVRQVPPRGYGIALHTAFETASREIIITLDCDGTYPAQEMSTLLAKIDEGFDLVSGSRLGTRTDSMPLANYIANQVFAGLAMIICGVKSTDVHTGMRAYRRRLLQDFKYDPHGMALPVELQVGPAQLGYRCTEIFIEYKPRIGESKLQLIPGTIWTLKRLWKWRRWSHKKQIGASCAKHQE